MCRSTYAWTTGTVQMMWLFTAVLFLFSPACTSKNPAPTALTTISPMTAEEYYRKAMDYAQDESYWERPFEAFSYFEKAAELGHAAAQERTAWAYQYGMGIERNLYKAEEWYRKAANGGIAKAQNSLGFFRHFGLGGKKNQQEAFSWIQKAADQNDPAGLSNMGALYEEGKIVPEDYTKAAKYYSLAAEQNYCLAQSNLGALTIKGRGVKKDSEHAIELFRKACVADHRYGFAGCYNLLKHSSEYTPLQGEHLKAKGILEKACNDDQSVACQFSGFAHLNGWGTKQDSKQAAAFFQNGCALGDVESCTMAGELYYFGDGVAEDKTLAITLLEKACTDGYEESCSKLNSVTKGFYVRNDKDKYLSKEK